MKKYKSGFSIVEVLVASAVLGFAAIVVMQLQQSTSKQTRQILDVSSSVKALLNIQKKIIEEDRYLPPQDGLANPETWPVITTTPETASNPADVDAWSLLDNKDVSGMSCFDGSGTWLACPKKSKEDDPEAWKAVRYEARYVKVRVLDRSQGLSASLRRIPIARFYIEISYPSETREKEVLRFTRLVSNAMLY